MKTPVWCLGYRVQGKQGLPGSPAVVVMFSQCYANASIRFALFFRDAALGSLGMHGDLVRIKGVPFQISKVKMGFQQLPYFD